MLMLKYFLLYLPLFLFCTGAFSQVPKLYKELYNAYPKFQADGFEQRRFKHAHVKQQLQELQKDSRFTVQQVGTSIEGRELFLASIGKGSTNVFLWSQMHGDESTATMSLFDIFKFLQSEDFSTEKEKLLSSLTIHFLPMLNPDGAEKFQRRNALGVDVNRDALRLQSPESQTLKRVRDSLNADFGFNLHDQSKYYNTGRTGKPATISFLAPAYNYEKSINDVRANALKVIIEINELLQEYIPGQVGRYNDDFEPRAFGDNIQKWGTSTILIESGGQYDDPEKQEIRRLNFTIILAALFSISNESYKNNNLEAYKAIPENDRMLFDLKISNLTYNLRGTDYIIDMGINREEVELQEGQPLYYRGYIGDRGDLSTSFGYEEFDAKGYKIMAPKVYPESFSLKEVEEKDLYSFLREGYGYIKIEDLPEVSGFISQPVNLVPSDFEAPDNLGPTLFLERNGKLEFAVINGFFISLTEANTEAVNGLIIN